MPGVVTEMWAYLQGPPILLEDEQGFAIRQGGKTIGFGRITRVK